MAESTLSLALDDLAGEVGLFLGYGRGSPLGDPPWNTQQQAAITSCVKSGLRQFYFPPPIEGQESAYDWSFLKPVASVTFAQGASTIALPDDFGGFEGQITLSSTASQVSWPVDLVHEGTVRQRYSELPNASGRPLIASLQPLKPTTLSSGQRFQLFLFPLADQAYTLQFEYYVLADYLTGLLPYALGGMAHIETILESCLSIAEQRLDDASSVHSMKFKERLLGSISLDRRNKAQKLGYNADRSDRMDQFNRRNHYWDQLTTVNGVQY